MARQIIFIGPADEQIFNLRFHILDLTKKFTTIYDPDYIPCYRIWDEVDNFDIDKNRIRVNYSTGAYLIVKP